MKDVLEMFDKIPHVRGSFVFDSERRLLCGNGGPLYPNDVLERAARHITEAMDFFLQTQAQDPNPGWENVLVSFSEGVLLLKSLAKGAVLAVGVRAHTQTAELHLNPEPTAICQTLSLRSRPSSTARRKGVPWAMRSPNMSSLTSACASTWIIATGPWRSAIARRMGSAMVWSPPSVSGMQPASTTRR